MHASRFQAALRLSGVLAFLTLLASAAGAFVPGVYRDNLWASTQWIGNDVVTLFVAVPLLIGGVWGARRGSLRAHLVWLGMLGYVLYGYAFYLFGAAFNELFLVYAAAVGLAIPALAFAALALDAGALARRFEGLRVARGVSVFLFAWALFLGGLWTAQSLAFVATGEAPAVIEASGLHTSVVFAVDLALMVPGLVLAAVWLWQGRAWGVVLAVAYNVKGAVYALALVAMSVSQAHAGILEEWGLAAVWVGFTVGCTAAATLLLRALRPEPVAA